MAWSKSTPTVSAVEKVPRRKEYLLRLSDGSTLKVLEEHLSRFALEEGRSIGEDTIERVRDSYEYAKAMEVVLRLLRVRPRTEAELRRRLRNSDLRGKIWERVLDDLKRGGQVDDRAFARLWIREKIGRAASGRKLITKDLRARGIDQTIIKEEIAKNYDETKEADIARQLVLRRSARMEDLPAGARRRRLYNLLLRRGFESDVASAALESVSGSVNPEDAT